MLMFIVRFVIHVVAPITLGGVIYLVWRSDALLMFRWIEAIGIAEWLLEIRQSSIVARPEELPPALLYSLPDAAWAYSSAMFFSLLWHDIHYRVGLGLFFLGPGCAACGEVGQALRIVPGTFDTVDLLLVVLATCIAFLTLKTWRTTS